MTIENEQKNVDSQLEALSAILLSINTLHEKLVDVKPTISSIQLELREHIKDETLVFLSAFPDGNAEGHRRAHEAQILKAEADAKIAQDKAEIWFAIKKKAAEMTVYGFIIALSLMVVYFWNGHMPEVAHIHPSEFGK
jgi:prefoldin subunit 5